MEIQGAVLAAESAEERAARAVHVCNRRGLNPPQEIIAIGSALGLK